MKDPFAKQQKIRKSVQKAVQKARETGDFRGGSQAARGALERERWASMSYADRQKQIDYDIGRGKSLEKRRTQGLHAALPGDIVTPHSPEHYFEFHVAHKLPYSVGGNRVVLPSGHAGKVLWRGSVGGQPHMKVEFDSHGIHPSWEQTIGPDRLHHFDVTGDKFRLNKPTAVQLPKVDTVHMKHRIRPGDTMVVRSAPVADKEGRMYLELHHPDTKVTARLYNEHWGKWKIAGGGQELLDIKRKAREAAPKRKPGVFKSTIFPPSAQRSMFKDMIMRMRRAAKMGNTVPNKPVARVIRSRD